MRKSRARILGAVLLAMLLVFGVSCAKQKVATVEEGVAPEAPAVEEQAVVEEQVVVEEQPEPTVEREEVTAMAEDAMRRDFEGQHINFDFDKYVLTPQSMMILDEKAAWLREHPRARVLIEGHADERGSNEYNLALGDRRANSAKNYLVKSGVNESRMTTISYGEEQPLCLQSHESCWWRNRRAQFDIR